MTFRSAKKRVRLDDSKERFVQLCLNRSKATRQELIQKLRTGATTSRDLAEELVASNAGWAGSSMDVCDARVGAYGGPHLSEGREQSGVERGELSVQGGDNDGWNMSVAEQIAEAIAFELEILEAEAEAYADMVPPEEDLLVVEDLPSSSQSSESSDHTMLCPICFKKTLQCCATQRAWGEAMGMVSCECGLQATMRNILTNDTLQNVLADVFDRHARYCSTVPKEPWRPVVGSLTFSNHNDMLVYECRECASSGAVIGTPS